MKPDATKCQLLVETLLQGKRINWARQIPFAQQLITFCDDLSFWLKVKNDLKVDVYSLAFFLCDNQKVELQKQKKLFFLDKSSKPSYNLEEKNLSQDVKTTKKLKTLRDFIKNA